MKVFVAGATGVIGWRAVQRLVAAGPRGHRGRPGSPEKAELVRALGREPVRGVAVRPRRADGRRRRARRRGEPGHAHPADREGDDARARGPRTTASAPRASPTSSTPPSPPARRATCRSRSPSPTPTAATPGSTRDDADRPAADRRRASPPPRRPRPGSPRPAAPASCCASGCSTPPTPATPQAMVAGGPRGRRRWSPAIAGRLPVDDPRRRRRCRGRRRAGRARRHLRRRRRRAAHEARGSRGHRRARSASPARWPRRRLAGGHHAAQPAGVEPAVQGGDGLGAAPTRGPRGLAGGRRRGDRRRRSARCSSASCARSSSLLALSALQLGLWARRRAESFYDDFPGFGRQWVSVDGPYNEHLVRDFGSSHLALAVVLLAAFLRPSATSCGRRRSRPSCSRCRTCRTTPPTSTCTTPATPSRTWSPSAPRRCSLPGGAGPRHGARRSRYGRPSWEPVGIVVAAFVGALAGLTVGPARRPHRHPPLRARQRRPRPRGPRPRPRCRRRRAPRAPASSPSVVTTARLRAARRRVRRRRGRGCSSPSLAWVYVVAAVVDLQYLRLPDVLTWPAAGVALAGSLALSARHSTTSSAAVAGHRRRRSPSPGSCGRSRAVPRAAGQGGVRARRREAAAVARRLGRLARVGAVPRDRRARSSWSCYAVMAGFLIGVAGGPARSRLPDVEAHPVRARSSWSAGSSSCCSPIRSGR